mmetsp:Transcript_7578/g.12392  ORF Transcript_7578/g.12392 Transcript_7578/m.12392 type:complete len:294 (-) Transcript_7578:502-1383(-)
MSAQQHSEFIHSALHIFIQQQCLFQLTLIESLCDKLMQRQHRVIARMIRIMHSRSIHHFILLLHRKIITECNALIVCHQPSNIRAFHWRPRTHLSQRARLLQVNRRAVAKRMLFSVIRQHFFMRTPAEFSRLMTTFRDKAIDAPRVDKLVFAFTDRRRSLRVALGNVHHFHSQRMRKRRPLRSRIRRHLCLIDVVLAGIASVDGDIHQCLLHEMRHHSWIGAMARDCRRVCCRVIGVFAFELQHTLSQSVVAALRDGLAVVAVAALPWLHHRVNVHDVVLHAVFHGVDRRDIH